MQYLEGQAILLFFSFYVIIAGSLALMTRFFTIPFEIIRKGYHIMATSSILILLYAFYHWISALVAVVLLACIVCLVLPLAIKIPGMQKLSIGREGKFGEVLKQAGYFFITLAILITLIWGIFGDSAKVHIIIGMGALGIGDAVAALIGKKYGKHRFKKIFDPHKTIEGSLAMASAVLIFSTVIYYYLNEAILSNSIFPALIISVVSTLVVTSQIIWLRTRRIVSN